MGKRFLRSIVSDFQALTASADVTPVDLPVNPLSFLVLTLQGTGADEATTGNYSLLSDFVTGISDLSVRHKGENILQGSLADLTMLNYFLTGYRPLGAKLDGDVGRVRSMSFLLSFSRKPYWHGEAFPATTRGNLRFNMTAGALPTAFTARSWALEALELIEDEPETYLKYTTFSRALIAGRQRLPLPLGNEIVGILLFDPTTTQQDAASFEYGKVKVLKDNVEQYYAESNWESLFDAGGQRGGQALELMGHTHFITAAQMNQTAVANAAARTEEASLIKNEIPLQYNFLDFDPLKDGSYSLETAGASTLDLDANADTGAGTSRYLPVELIRPVKG